MVSEKSCLFVVLSKKTAILGYVVFFKKAAEFVVFVVVSKDYVFGKTAKNKDYKEFFQLWI